MKSREKGLTRPLITSLFIKQHATLPTPTVTKERKKADVAKDRKRTFTSRSPAKTRGIERKKGTIQP